MAEGVESDGATVVDVWRRWADEVSGFNVPGGHLIAEDASDDVIRLVPPFLEAAENRRLDVERTAPRRPSNRSGS